MNSGIRQWLGALGPPPQYAEAFEASDVDMALPPRLNDQALGDTGVASTGNR
jgi:hypothetical protein